MYICMHTLLFPKTFPVTSHTDYVGKGSTFVAIKGERSDGVLYIERAIKKGATHVVVHTQAHIPDRIMSVIEQHNITLTRVPQPRLALAELSAQAAGHPAKKLKIIGVTGTKGKTTTVFLTEHLFKTAGYKTALLSTITNKIGDQSFATELTTQQPDYLHQFLKLCVEVNVEYVVMEVAAQALSLHRVATIMFDGIIFTNFSHEHGEFYATLEEYFAAKCLIFNSVKQNAPVVINNDNEWLKQYVQNSNQRDIHTYSLRKKAQICHEQDQQNSFEAHIVMTYPYIAYTVFVKDRYEVNQSYNFECSHLIGEFNIYNCLAAISIALCFNIAVDSIARGMQSFMPLPGRLERYILPNGARCYIDYAHNPDSYQAVLSLLKSITQHLIVVFGAGGNKDITKRAIMGSVASEYADIIILTSDNPRTEDPYSIINAIYGGITRSVPVFIDVDRQAAIKKAYDMSQANSVIAVLGKGPDEYQIIGTKKYYFSDVKVVQSLGR